VVDSREAEALEVRVHQCSSTMNPQARTIERSFQESRCHESAEGDVTTPILLRRGYFWEECPSRYLTLCSRRWTRHKSLVAWANSSMRMKSSGIAALAPRSGQDEDAAPQQSRHLALNVDGNDLGISSIDVRQGVLGEPTGAMLTLRHTVTRLLSFRRCCCFPARLSCTLSPSP
jgi:hypothetical protein